MSSDGCNRALRSPLCRAGELVATLLQLARLRPGAAPLAEPDLGRRLTCCWVLSLALLAFATTLTTGLAVLLAVEQHDHGAIVNEAASQRARSQRIAALLPQLADPDPVEAELGRIELLRIVDRMEAVFRGLLVGDPPPAQRTAALRAHYFEGPLALAPRLARFLAELRALLRDIDDGHPPDGDAVSALRREALGPLLALLDQATSLHEAYLRRDVERLVAAIVALGALVLLLIVAIGFWIFRPMTRGLVGLVGDLERLAHEDPLTGLLNRRAVVDALARAIAAGRSIATIAVDLDHFKEANERAGHAGGDALLRAVSSRLRASVRKDDIVGRIGGDEFVVFLLNIEGEAELAPIVERIRGALHEPVPLDGRLLPLGATLGVALCPEDARDPEILLRLADEALLRAKRERRGSVGRATREDALGIEVARELRTLLDGDAADRIPEGLMAVFQPIVGLEPSGSPRLLGFEALTRWHHPRLGPIPPQRLFGAACDRVSAVQLGRLARRTALASFATLRGRPGQAFRLALNLAPAEVFEDRLVDDLLADLEAAGVAPEEITIEITEEVLLERVSGQTLAHLAALRERGVRLALDDFGTGTSGLAQLLRLPIDLVKIDRRFVQELGRERKAVEIVRATVALARSLGLAVVAEGVETEEQAGILVQLGCDGAQGYLYGRPMGLAEALQWLAARAEGTRAAGGKLARSRIALVG